MRKFIRITAFLLIFVILSLASCRAGDNKTVQVPSDTDALAVIGTVEDFEETTSEPEPEAPLK